MLATPILVAYLHLSAHAQGLANQKPGVLKYCAQHGFGEPLLIEYTASGKVDWQKRKVGQVLLTNPPSSILVAADAWSTPRRGPQYS
ncbi:hypothetical protein ACUH78_17530 [Thauera sp. ZXT1-4]|uniref:hypothetical protein n=1 Tax=Thauera sp. ZXT1-4 TaxID=3460294 RepID=UPI004040B852